MKLQLALFPALIVPASLLAAPPARSDAPATVSADQPVPTAELRLQLIASLRADLLALRKAKEPNTSIHERLGQAIEFLGRETDPPALARTSSTAYYENRGSGLSWLALVQANGSDKSAALAARLAAQHRREVAEAEAAQAATAEALGKRAATEVFQAGKAQELDTLLAEIDALVRVQGRYPSDGTQPLQRLGMLHQFLINWQNHLVLRESGRQIEALQALRNLSSGSRDIPWIPRSELTRQIGEAARKSGRPSPEDMANQINALIDKGLAAEQAAAVDPLLTEARRLQTIVQQEDSGQFGNRISGLITFLERWQDVLSAKAAGSATKLAEVTRQLSNYELRQLEIPRSRLLERMYEVTGSDGTKTGAKAKPGDTDAKLERPAAIIERTKTLDHLATNLEALRRAVQLESSQGGSNEGYSSLLSELTNIAQTYQQLERGSAVRVSLGLTGSSTHPLSAELRRQLAVLALQRLVGDDAKLTPEAGENALTYLRQMLQAGRERKDWRLVQRILDTANSTNVQDPLLRSSDTTALTSFLAGLNQERARQYAFAVSSYQAALKTGSDLIPVDEIGERLDKISRESPTAYAQGLEWAVAPPSAPRDPFGRPIDPRTGQPLGSSFPGSRAPGNPTAGEQPVVIPERKSATAAPVNETKAPAPAPANESKSIAPPVEAKPATPKPATPE